MERIINQQIKPYITNGSEIGVSIVCNGVSIKSSRHGMHLGNFVRASTVSFITATAMENASYDLYLIFNLLLTQFGGCSGDVLYELFKSFCHCTVVS